MSTEEQVIQIIGKILNCNPENIRLEANLKDDLGATSLDRYSILMDLEETFSLNLDDISEEELEQKISTVADIVALLKRKEAN